MSDEVKKPAHYTAGEIECVDAIEAMLNGYADIPPRTAFACAQVLRYLWRYPLKGGVEDLYKAQQWLHRAITGEWPPESEDDVARLVEDRVCALGAARRAHDTLAELSARVRGIADSRLENPTASPWEACDALDAILEQAEEQCQRAHDKARRHQLDGLGLAQKLEAVEARITEISDDLAGLQVPGRTAIELLNIIEQTANAWRATALQAEGKLERLVTLRRQAEEQCRRAQSRAQNAETAARVAGEALLAQAAEHAELKQRIAELDSEVHGVSG